MRAVVSMFVVSTILAVPTRAIGQTPPCRVGLIEGAWLFATHVGHFSSQPQVPERLRGKDITAVGTMNIDGRGNISGTFDYTLADVGSFLNNTYAGTVIVNGDCTGTLSFTDSTGATRTDSIAVFIRRDQAELLGMSRNHLLMWTWTARRLNP